MSVKELLFGAQLKAPLTVAVNSALASQFAGIAFINSGTASVTVSTTVVRSNSMIIPVIQSLTDQASGVGRGVEVRSIVENGYFILGFADGKTQPRDVNVHWILINQK